MALIQKCWLTKLSVLLLLMSRAAHVVDTRPTSRGSDLITGSEFLKLFMERDELQRGFQSAEYQGHGVGAPSASKMHVLPTERNDLGDSTLKEDIENVDASMKPKTRNSARSINYNVHSGGNINRQTISDASDGKQVVKLVTSGSKIVFLEEFDEADDAVVDAVARDIDLKREKVKGVNQKMGEENLFRHHHQQEHKATPNNEFKVVAVSSSSSSKRGSSSHQHHHAHQQKPKPKQPAAKETPKQVSKFSIKSSLPDVMESRYSAGSSTTKRPIKVPIALTASTPLTTTATMEAAATATATTTTMSTSVAATNDIDDFINRSHKSEFSIEEAEPLTMPQNQQKQQKTKMRRAHSSMPDAAIDSQNSASTNVQKVLVSPLLLSSASVRSSSIVPVGVNRNSTQAHINQSEVTYDSSAAAVEDVEGDGDGNDEGGIAAGEEKLLPFQTVIYHDTKEGHGPQSRSISYSSLSQNVGDLQRWEHRTGILAEAQRNVSESLKPSPKTATQSHESEPAKFYSVPSKMYSIPSKFYSEPAKVYSEPSKVYGEPEKFYSEPSKVYGQPSKFYSEPAKVYSQPAKVYGEPAKTYWPQTTSITTTTTSTSQTTTTVTPASKSIITTFSPFASPFNLTSRRPAIVSRIAFGEAQSPSTTTRAPGGGYRHENYHQHNHHNQYQSLGQGQNTPSRRVLFNLDKLPYDLLNAPEQHLLEPDLSRSQPNPCSQHHQQQQQPQQQQHLRQHSSFSDQHSNQNAKGLPNRDLVKCVSKFSVHHSPAAAAAAAESAARRPPSSSSSSQAHNHFTTERSHIDELYRPTPEQNYEIEESVSVMTNGRAHGVQDGRGGVGLGAMTTTSTTPTPPKVHRLRPGTGPASGLRSFGHVKINRNNDGDDDGDGDGEDDDEEHDVALVHRGNKNNHRHHQQHYLNNNDYDGDNGEGEENGDVDGDDGGDVDDDNDDSKVAYVVEGRNYRKYRVEEKTDDGFIVGEFGVVNHDDGNLRGVRYTADSTINPSLIQKALLTFLKLK